MSPGSRDAFRADLCLVQTTTAAGVSKPRGKAALTAWNRWTAFCNSLELDPLLPTHNDPIPILQVFAHRYRTGQLSSSGRPVRARTVEDRVRQIGQAFSGMGAPDPRLNRFGTLDFRLQRQQKSYSKADPPPTRVKPIPLTLLMHAHALAVASHDTFRLATMDMAIIAFQCLMRPGEYAGLPNPRINECSLFRLQDVQLWIGEHRINILTCPLPDLSRATFISLTFTNQKSGVRGEIIGHDRSGHPQACPVCACGRRITHLRHHQAAPTTPLNAINSNHRWYYIVPSNLTTALQTSAALLGPSLGFLPQDISARSLRAGGAMALLCAQVDTDRIRLIGRWRSDEML